MRRRRVAIRPSDLDNPERGLHVATRVPVRAHEPAEADEQGPDESESEPAADGPAARIAAARRLLPEHGHWAACWEQGRDDAADAVTAGSVAAARALVAPARIGCRDCWEKGRAAALRVIDGSAG